MSASQTVSAAIEYLEELQGRSTSGPWVANSGYVEGNEPWETPHGQKGPRSIFMAEGNYVEGYAYNHVDADLIAALHRTISVQLTILRAAHRTCVKQESRGEVPKGPALDLAAAILGGIA